MKVPLGTFVHNVNKLYDIGQACLPDVVNYSPATKYVQHWRAVEITQSWCFKLKVSGLSEIKSAEPQCVISGFQPLLKGLFGRKTNQDIICRHFLDNLNMKLITQHGTYPAFWTAFQLVFQDMVKEYSKMVVKFGFSFSPWIVVPTRSSFM